MSTHHTKNNYFVNKTLFSMMRDAILDFAKQFAFRPTVIRKGRLRKKKKFVVCGMGGSQLAAHLLRGIHPELDIQMHRNYGLPELPDLSERLIIISSYSGNTEEVIDGFHEAIRRKLSVAAFSVGGELERIAEKNFVPFVKLPNTGIQPRSALGFSILGLLKLMGREKDIGMAHQLSRALRPKSLEREGKEIAAHLSHHVPVIYSSARNEGVAYNWKIKINETGKIPAFYNVFPELNHNEMSGFDIVPGNRALSKLFSFIFLTDNEDHPRIQRRMEVLLGLYRKKRLPVRAVTLTGKNRFEKVFRSLLVADWTAWHTAQRYGLESESVALQEEFKRSLKH
ncbi:MAG: SIS domain-containing protein [Patescibacteria group bacterium]